MPSLSFKNILAGLVTLMLLTLVAIGYEYEAKAIGIATAILLILFWVWVLGYCCWYQLGSDYHTLWIPIGVGGAATFLAATGTQLAIGTYALAAFYFVCALIFYAIALRKYLTHNF